MFNNLISSKVIRSIFFVSVFIISLFTVYAGNTEQTKSDIPSYTVGRTSVPIVLDGKLDDPVWTQAEERVMSDAYTGGETPLKSTFRMLWDDSFLYVGVYFEDNDAWATYTEEDEPLWEEEVLELFIDADCDGSTYYEHEINPLNVKVDQHNHRYQRFRKYFQEI